MNYTCEECGDTIGPDNEFGDVGGAIVCAKCLGWYTHDQEKKTVETFETVSSTFQSEVPDHIKHSTCRDCGTDLGLVDTTIHNHNLCEKCNEQNN